MQFRMEGELGRRVGEFALRNGLGLNQAAKALIALAVVGLDGRYYPLVRQLADALGGQSPFVAACTRLHASLDGAAVATGRTAIPDGERPGFVLRVVESALSDRGRRVNVEGLWFGHDARDPAPPASLPPPHEPSEPSERSLKKRRRTIRSSTQSDNRG